MFLPKTIKAIFGLMTEFTRRSAIRLDDGSVVGLYSPEPGLCIRMIVGYAREYGYKVGDRDDRAAIVRRAEKLPIDCRIIFYDESRIYALDVDSDKECEDGRRLTFAEIENDSDFSDCLVVLKKVESARSSAKIVDEKSMPAEAAA